METAEVIEQQIQEIDEKIKHLTEKKLLKETLLKQLSKTLRLRIMFQNRLDGSYLLEPPPVHYLVDKEDWPDNCFCSGGRVKDNDLYRLDKFCKCWPGFIAYKAWIDQVEF